MKRCKCKCFCVPRKAKARSATLPSIKAKRIKAKRIKAKRIKAKRIKAKRIKTKMFTHLPSDMIRDISAFLDTHSLGSMSNVSSGVHSELDQVMKLRMFEYMNRPPTEVNGTKLWYDDEGLLHRINGPAMIEILGIHVKKETWYYRGKKCREEWRWNNELHRRNGPAVLMYNNDGIRIREEWWCNDKLHRENAPAVKEFNIYEDINECDSDDWRSFGEEWWVNGVCRVEEWWFDGVCESVYKFYEDNETTHEEIWRFD